MTETKRGRKVKGGRSHTPDRRVKSQHFVRQAKAFERAQALVGLVNPNKTTPQNREEILSILKQAPSLVSFFRRHLGAALDAALKAASARPLTRAA